jgi:hypothetical protein
MIYEQESAVEPREMPLPPGYLRLVNLHWAGEGERLRAEGEEDPVFELWVDIGGEG